MDTIIFLGPSLPINIAKKIFPEAQYLPPAGCGDIIRAVSKAPKRIALIDGYFHHQAAVWHKEILFALEQSILVLGASSMGALRAAELYQYGMHGVGTIFEQYRDGILIDDDEVAVIHAGARQHYQPLSDAMVNIRSLLQQAVQEEIITMRFFSALIDFSKRQYYPCRQLLGTLNENFHNHAESTVLINWLKINFYSQKSKDAIELLLLLNGNLKLENKRFIMNHTVLFNQLVQSLAPND
jgi:hypothetical protein